MKFYYVYILLCSDNSYYTGMTNDLDRRITQHNSGHRKFNYTSTRLPVELKMVFTMYQSIRSNKD
ncbi:GIY-YIG nuclease family protein [Muricauda sp. NFXS6]|uniref:GIY-YIG nuclease family protein n=1 Tax=Allomuricauda sp. NFXS6 TaxID=2819094 RepID=UPI0032DE5FCB